MSNNEKAFVFIESWIVRCIYDDSISETEMCRYKASFWEGPIEAGQIGRYVEAVLETPFYRDRLSFLNVSPSASFHDQMIHAMRKKPSRVVTHDFRNQVNA